MASNSFLKIFLPKDKVFFQLFESVAETVIKMGNRLKDVVHEKDFETRGDYIKEIVQTGKARISHEYDPLFGTFVISASSQQLEQFLEKYGDDERLYSEENTITLFRKA